MTRIIICLACFKKRGPMHHEDVVAGWTQRIVTGQAHKPAEHNVKFYEGKSLDSLKLTKTQELSSLVCDHCNTPIPDGTDAKAITMWRPSREVEPLDWEKDYLV